MQLQDEVCSLRPRESKSIRQRYRFPTRSPNPQISRKHNTREGGLRESRQASLHPLLDQSHLLLRQSPLSQKFAVPRDWSPRRHYFGLHNGSDQASMLANIVVGAQRKRRDFSGPMASDAIII